LQPFPNSDRTISRGASGARVIRKRRVPRRREGFDFPGSLRCSGRPFRT